MYLVCAHCGTRNQFPDARLADGPVCGQCKQPLAPATPLALDADRFDRYVDGTELPVVVDFWAEWCGPCKMMAPEFAKAAAQRPGVRFVKLDTDAAPELATRHGIRSIPTLALFQGGREVARISGAMQAGQLVAWLDQQSAG
jgi:thioredoxin 2